MRLGEIAVAYFVLGAVMFGGGAIPFDDTGLTQVMLTQDGDGEVSIASGFADQWESITTSPTVFDSLGGAMIMIWDILVLILGGAFWPVLVLLAVNAPTEVVLLGGGSISFAFIVAGLRFIRSSL